MNGITRVLLFSLALTPALVPAASAQGLTVAVFDAQAVSENSEMGKRIQAQLTAFTERKETEITERQNRLAEMRQNLTQQSLSLSAERRASLEKDIKRNMLELHSFQESASRELELEYGTATKEFRDKLVVAVDEFGRNEGLTVILDRSQVAWSAPSVDVTTALIDLFNQMFPVNEKAGE